MFPSHFTVLTTHSWSFYMGSWPQIWQQVGWLIPSVHTRDSGVLEGLYEIMLEIRNSTSNALSSAHFTAPSSGGTVFSLGLLCPLKAGQLSLPVFFFFFIHLLFYLHIYVSIHLSIILPIYPASRLPTYPLPHPSIHSPIHPVLGDLLWACHSLYRALELPASFYSYKMKNVHGELGWQ